MVHTSRFELTAKVNYHKLTDILLMNLVMISAGFSASTVSLALSNLSRKPIDRRGAASVG
jgi:hypothetical protein